MTEPPDPQVPAKARRRRYSAKYKADVLAEYEAADREGKGALLRREGLYSSLISAWRDQRDRGAREALGRSGGAPPATAAEKEAARLRKENQRLRADLDKAEAVIEVQGKTLRAAGAALDQQQRRSADAMIDETITELTVLVGTKAACEAVGRSRATHYRRHRRSPAPPHPRREPARQPRALTEGEEREVLTVLRSERFVDMAPAEIHAVLLDEGTYLCSVSTMYRLLRRHGEVRERRRQATHPPRVKPELAADGPNRVWPWDITKLHGPVKWSYYYLYSILDIFSRYTVGWMVAPRESAQLAERLLAETIAKQGVDRDQLTIHADNGSSMASRPVAFLLADLGVTKTHSRPHVSNDNPYSEAQFKTLKYRPEFPDEFASIEHAREFSNQFFTWYNTEHRHSGIGMHTPLDVHYGRAEAVRRHRADVLTAAYTAHPERFVRHHPVPPALPETAWINPPAPTTKDPTRDSTIQPRN
ncbi:IS3 family transposase [Brachybacterium paraconglomeratum]|uniref:IS3 family transposase n=1 Tax=Brachybacterium paraconglomeratum TaxID=173362 RepID=UPI0037CB0611